MLSKLNISKFLKTCLRLGRNNSSWKLQGLFVCLKIIDTKAEYIYNKKRKLRFKLEHIWQ